MTNVVVIGAGYAGMMCAIRLAGKTRHQDVNVTLINATDHFVERVRLHELAIGKDVKHQPIESLIKGTGVKFVEGWVTSIDRTHQAVSLSDGRIVSYDYLVYALGSSVDQKTVPGVAEYAHVLNLYDETLQLKATLNEWQGRQAKVVIVGSGSTGIEAASEIRAAHPGFEIQIITQGNFATFKGPRVQPHFRAGMTAQGILVIENMRVTEIDESAITTADGSEIPYDICIWAGGFVAPGLAQEAGLAVNERRQALVDHHLRSIQDHRIFIVGDAAKPVYDTGAPVRMSAFFAMVTGAHVADSITRLVKGKSMKPFSFSTYGQGIAMGPDDAVGFMTFPNDQPVGWLLRGKLAVGVRSFFVWFLAYSLVIERHIPGFFLWFGKRRYSRQQIAQLEEQYG